MNDVVQLKLRLGKRGLAMLLAMLLLFACLPFVALGAPINARSVVLQKLEGTDVKIQKGTDKKYAAKANTKLGQGYVVHTGKKSVAYLLLDGNTVAKIAPNSQIKLSKASSKKLKLEVVRGTVAVNAAKQKKDEELEVGAGNASMGIRGTLFVATYEEEKFLVDLFSGEVSFRVGGTSPVSMTAGNRMTISKKGEAESQSKATPLQIEDLNSFALEIMQENKEEVLKNPLFNEATFEKLPALITQKQSQEQAHEEKLVKERQNIQDKIEKDKTEPTTPTNPTNPGGGGGGGGGGQDNYTGTAAVTYLERSYGNDYETLPILTITDPDLKKVEVEVRITDAKNDKGEALLAVGDTFVLEVGSLKAKLGRLQTGLGYKAAGNQLVLSLPLKGKGNGAGYIFGSYAVRIKGSDGKYTPVLQKPVQPVATRKNWEQDQALYYPTLEAAISANQPGDNTTEFQLLRSTELKQNVSLNQGDSLILAPNTTLVMTGALDGVATGGLNSSIMFGAGCRIEGKGTVFKDEPMTEMKPGAFGGLEFEWISGEGWVCLTEAVCDEVGYQYLKVALEAASSGSTVKLISSSSSTGTESTTIKEGVTLVIGAGKNLSIGSGDGLFSNLGKLVIEDGGNVTLGGDPGTCDLVGGVIGIERGGVLTVGEDMIVVVYQKTSQTGTKIENLENQGEIKLQPSSTLQYLDGTSGFGSITGSSDGDGNNPPKLQLTKGSATSGNVIYVANGTLKGMDIEAKKSDQATIYLKLLGTGTIKDVPATTIFFVKGSLETSPIVGPLVFLANAVNVNTSEWLTTALIE